MLRLDRIRTAHVERAPFRWCLARELFSAPAEVRTLVEQLHPEHLRVTAREAGAAKRYRIAVRQLVEHGRVRSGALDGLAPGWRQIVQDVTSARYAEAVGERLGIDLRRAVLEVRLCRYDAGCWMGPHTDRAEKIATQIIYLNPSWRREWGGCLRLLRSKRSGDVAAEVVPLLGTSVIFAPSERSWHEVPPVRPEVDEARLSLLLHFTGPQPDAR